MHFHSILTSLVLTASVSQAALNGACTANGKPGVCITTTDCSQGGGASVAGFCPNDPDNVRCCTKGCGSGGTCKFASSCSGTTQAGLCPGPADFKCCLGGSGGTPTPGPGGPNPVIPAANCRAHVIAAGNKVLNQFPGKVKNVWCYAAKAGEHGEGRALDFMVGANNPIGQTIAEWVMNNAATLRVYYIIWGQRIWNKSLGEAPTGWANWRRMEDRGSITANHWDHPHVSFLA